MFRAIILPIFRSTRLCVTACGIKHPRRCRPPATYAVIVASSWLSILFIFHYIFLRLAKQSQFIPLENVVYFISLRFLVRKIFTFYISDVLRFKFPFPGPKGLRY